MKTIFSIARKDILVLFRDRSAYIWVVAFPLLMAVLFGSIFGGSGSGGGGTFEVAVIDQDGGARAKALVKALEDSGTVKVHPLEMEVARGKVLKGDLAAYVVLKKGLDEPTLMAPPEKPLLQVGVDPKRQMESGVLEGILSQAWFQELGKSSPYASQVMKQGTGIERVPVEQEYHGPMSAFEVSFPQAMLWGLVAVCASFAVTMVKERTAGTLQRLKLAPISRGLLLAGKGLACFLTCLGVVVGLMAFGSAVFKLGAFEHPVQLTVGVLCVAFCYSGLMMLVSVLGKTEQSVGGAGWGLMMLFNMFGGGMVPLMMMPGWMQALGSFSPAKWSILALEGAIWRDFSISEMVLPCALLIGFGVVAFGIGTWISSKLDG